MLKSLVEFSLRFKGVIAVLACVFVGYGLYVTYHAKLDVFPEFVPPQVIIQTEAPGFTPEDVERLVTRPLENALNGVGNLQVLQSETIQGLSVITVFFKEGTDVLIARQTVTERITEVPLPEGVHSPRLEPLTSSTMDLLKIGLSSDKLTPMELRTFCDWTLKPRLLAVPGVAKCSVFGGEVRELQIQVNPNRLRTFDLSLQDLLAAAKASTGIRGAGFIDTPNQRILLQSETPPPSAETLGNVIVDYSDGKPIRIKDVATVIDGAQVPVGDSVIMGKPGCLLTMSSQYGANTMEVTLALEKVLNSSETQKLFNDQGIVYHAALHRPASFIETSIGNITHSLILGGVLVAVILFLFLFNIRAAFISLTAIPLSLLAAIIVMDQFGYTLNTITLGGLAIAIGAVVDDAIIDVENIYRRLRENLHLPKPRSRFNVVLDASIEVRSAVVYATFVVILVFIPVITMTGLQGKFFAPLAWSYIMAILASLVVALTVTPALCLLLSRPTGAAEHEPWIQTKLKSSYRRILNYLTAHAGLLITTVSVILLVVLATLPFFGGEFLPDFREGHFVVGLSNLPGTSLQESRRLGILLELELLKNPHIKTVEEQIGRAELGEDTWGPEKSELHINLAPMSGEEEEVTQAEIRETIAKFPGLDADVTTFLGDRIGESVSGDTGAVVVNIFGNDLDVLDAKGKEIADVLTSIHGATDVKFESPKSPRMTIRLRNDRLTQFGFRPVEVLEAIEIAYEGQAVAQVFEADRVSDIAVILDPQFRKDPQQIGELPVQNAQGTRMLLRELADIDLGTGRTSISHQSARRRQTVSNNLEGVDGSTFVAFADAAIRSKVQFPDGYDFEISGPAIAQKTARNELVLHSAIAGIGILVLLVIVFGNWRNLFLLLVNLPFALVGGILAVILTAENPTYPALSLLLTHPLDALGVLHLGTLSIGALVGFVTLFGITTRNSIMLLSHYDHLVSAEGMTWGKEAALRGAAERLIPILMTALVTGIGLLPLALGTGEAGREIEGPMAVAILGGLVTSTALNLLVMPTLALRFGKFGVTKTPE